MPVSSLICSEENEKLILGILSKREIETGDNNGFSIVEKGRIIPDQGISIIFDSDKINHFLVFLDEIVLKEKIPKEKRITGRKDENYYPLNYNEIYYFFSKGNSIFCRTQNNQYEIDWKLYEIETFLSSKGFCRIGKSVVVNINFIEEIIPWFGSRLLLKLKNKKEELEVSRSYTGDFKKFMGM